MARDDDQFCFEISLSVLNHLGRHLYRSFMTVLGEAVSNSWDADAKNVWIYLGKQDDSLVIKDDGIGMDRGDFQNRFLKIGYSKRQSGQSTTPGGRPFIGRKGIGKLALLSCADRIHILSKPRGGQYVGGVIDNSGLDRAITQDWTPQQFILGDVQLSAFAKYTEAHHHGTIIYFEHLKDGIKHSAEYLKKLIALYFRFSLVDGTFNIFVDEELITIDCLRDLAAKTQFLWSINNLSDPYITKTLPTLPSLKEQGFLGAPDYVRGFLASVDTPKDLKVLTTEERVTVDLFVNGRLREKDILKHIPTARIVESYLYGQIHFDLLDDTKDRFSTSREGIVADDEKFTQLLDILKKILYGVIEDWDKWRIKHKKEGDSENTRISKKERKSRELFNAVAIDYSLPVDSGTKPKVDGWVDALADDAQFNFSSYAECFISENLLRKYIEDRSFPLSPEAIKEIAEYRERESANKGKGNISIEIRKMNSDLTYLSMDGLANLIDKARDPLKEARLSRDANEYKPIRDALAHTSLLTDTAKQKLASVYENIKGRVKTLLSGD